MDDIAIIQSLQSKLNELESRLNQHKHNGGDMTTRLYQAPEEETVGDTVFGGTVASGVAGAYFPSGWTSQKLATGQYRVTHSLGHTNYAVALGYDGNSFACVLQTGAKTTTYFDIQVVDIQNYATPYNFADATVDFILTY